MQSHILGGKPVERLATSRASRAPTRRRTPTRMRMAKSLVPTLREDPADAEAISHKLMLRAGLVRQLGAGIYVYLPLGHRVHDKITAIIREEMNAIGGQEITMPVIQPGRDLAEERALGRHPRDVQAQGPLGPRHGPGHDPRGGHRLARRPRDPLLPRPAADLVPDPDQGARRGPAALGRAAHARVRHEGLLHARSRRGGARSLLRVARGAPTGRSSSAAASRSTSRSPTPA